MNYLDKFNTLNIAYNLQSILENQEMLAYSLQKNIDVMDNLCRIGGLAAWFSMIGFGVLLWKLFKDEEKKNGI